MSLQTLLLQTNRCPLSGNYNRTYWCLMNFSSLEAVYRQHYRYYYITLTSTNDLGVLTENFTIDHYGSGKFINLFDKFISISTFFLRTIVIPDPVVSLETKYITTDSAVIQWVIPYQLITFPRSKCDF